MYMFENQITIKTKSDFNEYLNSFEYGTSDFSFTSLYMWREINRFSWQIIGDYLCLAGISHLELDKQRAFLFPPLTKTGTYEPSKLRKTILEAKKIFEKKNQEFSIRLLPGSMACIIETAFPGELTFIDDRPNFDYLYSKNDLIDLAGRKYHAKRNHLNHFKTHYSYKYAPLSLDRIDEAMDFIRKFNFRKEVPEHEMQLLKMEEKAMGDVFSNLEEVGYITGVIYIGGEIQALSIGGPLGKNTVTVHVEKADTKYRGAYQAINNEFCKHMEGNIRYMNREEDMDIQGLREAKLSYRPLRLVEKQIAVFK